MKTLNKILETVLGLLVAVMVLGCIWQVITRFVLNNPSKYTEELLRYLLIWTTMLGVPYAYGKDKHLSINIAVKYFSPKGKVLTQYLYRNIDFSNQHLCNDCRRLDGNHELCRTDFTGHAYADADLLCRYTDQRCSDGVLWN